MSFALHIDFSRKIEDLAKAVRGTPDLGLEAVETRKSLAGAWIDLGNEDVHLRLFENHEHDRRLMDDEDGWLYYPFILEGTPVNRKVPVDVLKNAANALIQRIRDVGGTVEILSDWDDEDIDL